ncbi:MAG: fumarylacetoacetate hydrolase family protein [Chloroflexi bacterium]|nr:fumarylacetoacetate hydrolase family protein [Chloroflexota bacterium]
MRRQRPRRLLPVIDHVATAATLDAAERDRAAIRPLTDTLQGLTVADAYAIQAAWLRRKLAANAALALVGRKVGLTARAMQEQLGVNEPDCGFLLNSMLVPNAGSIPRAELILPRVEPEIAFYLAEDLRGPDLTAADILEATRAVAPALEIVDSRIADWKIKLQDTIADNGSSARAVIGAAVSFDRALDLAAVQVTLRRDGEVVGEGAGAAVLGHPAEAVAWLANALAGFGEGLKANDVVLPGAMCASVFANAGEVFEASYTGLGSVSVRFT